MLHKPVEKPLLRLSEFALDVLQQGFHENEGLLRLQTLICLLVPELPVVLDLLACILDFSYAKGSG
jgi:hypothetical protein